MFTRVKEFLKAKIIKLHDNVKARLRTRRLKKLDPDLYCNSCKQPIRRGEFIAIIGRNKLLPALYAGSISRSYGWLLGSKKYCEKCFAKEFRR